MAWGSVSSEQYLQRRCMLVFAVFTLAAALLSLAFFPTGAQASSVNIRGTLKSESMSAALAQVNKYRKEACDKGYIDPRDYSRKLKPSDYVPIKWSSDLEEIARQRAVEASVRCDHHRPNDEICIDAVSSSGVCSWAENLAWTFDEGGSVVLSGVKMWYGEKSSWVKQEQGVVTGHYTSMIDPSNSYMALGCFVSGSESFATISGEFSSMGPLPTGYLPANKATLHRVDVLDSYIGKASVAASSSAKKGIALGKTAQLSAKLALNFPESTGYGYATSAQWTSNNTKCLTVSSSGKAYGVGVGFARVSVRAQGKTAALTLCVNPAATRISKVKAKKRAFTASWKKAPKVSCGGYELRWSTSKKMTKAKKLTVKGYKSGSKKIKKLKAKKKYYVQVRVYKKASGKTYYSAWSSAKKVKTK